MVKECDEEASIPQEIAEKVNTNISLHTSSFVSNIDQWLITSPATVESSVISRIQRMVCNLRRNISLIWSFLPTWFLSRKMAKLNVFIYGPLMRYNYYTPAGCISS